MLFPYRQLSPAEFPALLQEIPDPPKQLYLRGSLPSDDTKLLAVVGSRKYTHYGRDACESLITGLAGYPVSIVSGLALGMDAIAHRAALSAGIHTIAVPGSGVDDSVLYPRTNFNLGMQILEQGGALLSEFEPTFKAKIWSFPQRTRIMAALTHATLVIEAGEKSGTLITSRLATDYNRDVFTIPGSIFSATSAGPHMLIKLGATPVTISADILEALGIDTEPTVTPPGSLNLSPEETLIMDALTAPMTREALFAQIPLDPSQINILLTKLELQGLLVDSGGKIRRK